MKEYDIMVIGGGSGGIIAEQALAHGHTVAFVNKPPIGGTCQNFGCIPTKMLIYPADRLMEIEEAERLGIKTQVKSVDFKGIMERMRKQRKEGQEHQHQGIHDIDNLDYFEGEGKFIDEYILEVNGEQITADKIFIGTGARPLIPPIDGIDKVDYLTNESALELTEKPASMIIVGGGYVAVEFAHFFAAMGTNVTIFQRSNRLVKNEEPEISELLQTELEKRMTINTNTEVTEVKQQNGKITVVGKHSSSGKKIKAIGATLLIAAGRKSNADILQVEKTGIKTDKHGYIRVNEYLETSKPNIWAFGDAIGKEMFKHVANREAFYAWHNALHDHNMPMTYHASPHAVFSHPQIASVGLTEKAAKKDHEILVGKAKYIEVAKGQAMKEKQGFAKIIVDKNNNRILGFHIIGPYAAIVIQEVIDDMAIDGKMASLIQGLHIHPALPELVQQTLNNLAEP